MYKKLNAPFGAFAMATLTFSSRELASNHTNDGTYNSWVASRVGIQGR
jgi:hypothetical protein